MLVLSLSPVYKALVKSYVTPKKTSHEMAYNLRTLDGKLATTLNPLTVKVLGGRVDNCYFCGFFWHPICSVRAAALAKGSEANVMVWWTTGQSSVLGSPARGRGGEDSLSIQRSLGKKAKQAKVTATQKRLRPPSVWGHGGNQVSWKPH